MLYYVKHCRSQCYTKHIRGYNMYDGTACFLRGRLHITRHRWTSLKLGKRQFDYYLFHLSFLTRRLQSIFAVRRGLRPHLLNAAPLIELDVLMAAARLVRIEDPESVSSALRKNGHGGDELLGTANVSACRKTKETQNLRQGAAAGLADGASGGRQGAGRRRPSRRSGTMKALAKSTTRKSTTTSTTSTTKSYLPTGRQKGIGGCATHRVPIPPEPP